MKAAPLLVQWHNDHSPIYSVHFEPHGKGRLATSGGDNNVRIWKVSAEGEERKITYLSTLQKHTQAVNVVRFAPKGEVLATAGDDGNTLLWVPADTVAPAFGDDGLEDKETWRVKHMCRSGYEIYDLAWSPDAVFFMIGSIDNVARIYNAQTGQMVRQIAEHNHYVQGVTWDPLNEFVATQSSDRSVHIYNLRTKDGKFTLETHNKVSKMDLPGKLVHGQNPGDPVKTSTDAMPASPAPSASIPGTPTSLALPMNPPALTHSRRSSFASSPSHRRSASPAPSMPLPAVRPMENSPLPFTALGGFKNTNIYANETYTSFFRRLTFAPDGSLLFTPAGQYKISNPPTTEGSKATEDIINTVYIYTRAGLNKPPVTHLPGHKKASIAVKCSPVFYTLRQGTKPTVQITLDTSSADEAIPALPDPIVPTSAPSMMDPPRSTTMPSPKDAGRPTSSPRDPDGVDGSGPTSVFALPYRIVYAVATQDSILVYDTQQQTPLCVVSNLHFTTFTDLTWSSDGLTLLMSSSDGFCSTITFQHGELGSVYSGTVPHASTQHQSLSIGTGQSAQPSPVPTPTGSTAPSFSRLGSTGAFASPNPHGPAASPTKSRSNSVSSVATQFSFAQPPSNTALTGNSPTPIIGTIPSVTAGTLGSLPLSTPPATPMSMASLPVGSSASSLGKRDSVSTVEADDEDRQPKKRRIAPTQITSDLNKP